MRSAARKDLQFGEAEVEDALQVGESEGDAAFGRCVIGTSNVKKYSGTAVGDHRAIVPAEHADQIIEMVGAPKLFVRSVGGEPNLAVVSWVVWIVAPGVIGGQRFDGDGAAGRRQPVGTVEQPAEREQSDWRCVVAFSFVGTHAGGAEGGTKGLAAYCEAGTAAGSGMNGGAHMRLEQFQANRVSRKLLGFPWQARKIDRASIQRRQVIAFTERHGMETVSRNRLGPATGDCLTH